MYCTSRFPLKKCINKFGCQIIQNRSLFNLDSLKINTFKESCKNTADSIPNISAFKEEMKIKCEKDINHLIFVDDFKKMLGITKTDDDIDLLKDMLAKFSSQNNVIRFGSFKVGPQILRLFHVLNKPKEALDLIENSQFNWLFAEVTSFILLADLLFRNKMFDEVIKLTYAIINMQLKGKKYIPNLIILYFASCHKLNTSKSFENANNMWVTLKKEDFRCPLRGVWFFSHLALKQKQINLALDVISLSKSCAIGNNIKILAVTFSGQYQDVLSLLKELFLKDVPHNNFNNFITIDTLKCIETFFQKSTEENFKKFERLKEELFNHNLIYEMDLESCLFQEINYGAQEKKSRILKNM